MPHPISHQVLTHEIGHQLGFGHAAGTGSAAPSDEEAWKQSLANYGDSSAIMGNDASHRNSFSAVVRFASILTCLFEDEMERGMGQEMRNSPIEKQPHRETAP